MFKKTKIIVAFGGLFVTVTGCNSHPGISNYYDEVKKSFPPEYVDHLPGSGDGIIYSSGLITDDQYNTDGLSLLIKLSSSKKKEILDYVEKNAMAIYSFEDSCLMMVNYKYKLIEDKKIKIRNCIRKDFLPVTNFEHLYHPDIPAKFYEKAKIYVLEAKQGKYLDEDTHKYINVGLPEDWEHGYTKGVAIYKRYAAFWLEFW